MKYFATLNDTVIDGTPCQRPAEYYRSKSTYASRAMCVDGICKVNVNKNQNEQLRVPGLAKDKTRYQCKPPK